MSDGYVEASSLGGRRTINNKPSLENSRAERERERERERKGRNCRLFSEGSITSYGSLLDDAQLFYARLALSLVLSQEPDLIAQEPPV